MVSLAGFWVVVYLGFVVSGLVLGCAWWGLVCWLSLRLYVWVVVRRCVCFGDWWGVLFVLGCVGLWWVLDLIGFGFWRLVGW